MTTRTKLSTSLCLIATFALQALAQDSEPTTPQLLSPYLMPVTPVTPVNQETDEKIIDPSLSANPASPEAVWNGEKPFIAEMNAPHFPAATMTADMLESFEPAARAAFNLRETSVQELRMIDQPDQKLVAVRLPEGERVVRLHPYTMRASDAKLLVGIEGGVVVEHPWPEPATYRGMIDGTNVEVAASIQDGRVSMLMLPRDPAEPTWVMQPVSDAVNGLPESLHIVYRTTDVVTTDATCGVDDVNGHPVRDPGAPQPAAPLAQRLMDQLPPHWPDPTAGMKDIHGGSGGGSGPDGGSPEVANVRADIGFDADVEFYQANGSSINATVYDMELIMNQVGLIYQNQVAISYVTRGTLVRTVEPDPYNATNANTLLCQFGEWWNGNVSFTHDVAHLFTGKDLDGTTVGLGWIGNVCAGNFNNCNAAGSSLDYSLAQSRFTTTLNARVQDTAHELGHNWNGCHCNTGGNCGAGTSNPNCGIMTSNVSNGLLTFDSAAITAITTYRDSRGCLEAWLNPTYVNWAYGGTETGSFSQPWNTMLEGVNGAMYGGEIRATAGNYLQNIFINKIVTINTQGGTVRIGN